VIAFLADENFNREIVRGLLRRHPHLDIVTAQEAGLGGLKDAPLLAWAAEHQRCLLTHDVQTMKHYAAERLNAGLYLSGVFIVRRASALAKQSKRS
jgi:hypothetical protein